MSSYVCTELVNNVCQQWAENPSILPPLTMGQGLAIGGAIFTVLAFTHGIKILIQFVKKQ
ncbi:MULTISPECIES: hypothetical protein [Acinetobacter]|uniref:hypothetical protein n=1 Tax=Acinetobacter TaxID=469 RepID=UPI0014797130|nr:MULTISPECIES: hypothetical protein [Acinetobacter]MDS7958268.1 hypothetical protein [Acinetobacter sp. V104_13]MDS7981489.1 hypothetical protein [Acinetobacter sp. V104_3]MDX7905210.1 hypothetical protein [Acinetobacter baumannii]MDX7908804.1 hypothetical protein [Acinetobacter baumannii]MDX7928101.1 hypothetical protein [Acinetobacter baumannii]